MTLPRISPKRKKTVKLGFNSTFSVKPKAPKQLVTIAEMREQGLLKRASDRIAQLERQLSTKDTNTSAA